MGSMMKGEDDLLTLQIRGDGPIGGITVTADAKARVKGYVHNPDVMLPPNEEHKLDVGGAVGNGFLQCLQKGGGFLQVFLCLQEDLQCGHRVRRRA